MVKLFRLQICLLAAFLGCGGPNAPQNTQPTDFHSALTQAEVQQIDAACESGNAKKLAKLLYAEKRDAVELGMMELDGRINCGEISDLPDKFGIYQKILQTSDLSLIFVMTKILERLPEDKRITETAKKDIKQKEDTGRLIAAHRYLECFDEQYVIDNTPFKDYGLMTKKERALLYDITPIINLRNQWLQETLDKYIHFISYELQADEPNPYRQVLEEEGISFGYLIVSNPEKYASPCLPLPLVLLLGEFGGGDRMYDKVFDLLFQAHHSNPSYGTAISLGARVGLFYLEKMFDGFSPKSRQIFLESILTADEYKTMKDKSDEDLIEYWKKNFEKLRIRCYDRIQTVKTANQ